MADYKSIHGLTDEEILDKIRSKDTGVFTGLYRHYFYSLSLLADKYIKDMAVSEEVVQDVFLKMWEGPFQLADPKALRAYLSRTVINNAINYVKRQKNIEQHHQKIADESDVSLVNRYEEQELLSRIFKEIEKLPIKCGQVFKMSRFEGLTYREIAVSVGVSEKTVENHIINALKILRRSIFPEKSFRI